MEFPGVSQSSDLLYTPDCMLEGEIMSSLCFLFVSDDFVSEAAPVTFGFPTATNATLFLVPSLRLQVLASTKGVRH